MPLENPDGSSDPLALVSCVCLSICARASQADIAAAIAELEGGNAVEAHAAALAAAETALADRAEALQADLSKQEVPPRRHRTAKQEGPNVPHSALLPRATLVSMFHRRRLRLRLRLRAAALFAPRALPPVLPRRDSRRPWPSWNATTARRRPARPWGPTGPTPTRAGPTPRPSSQSTRSPPPRALLLLLLF